MSQIEVFSIENQTWRPSMPEWADPLTTRVGLLPRSTDLELSRCTSTGPGRFSGRLEIAKLDSTMLSKVAITPNLLSHLVRTPSSPVAAQLISQVSGSCRLEQDGRSCTLRAGDWCLVNALHPFNAWSLDERSECLILTIDRPSDTESRDLIDRAAVRRWSAKAGMSRVLHTTLIETFSQIDRLHARSRSSVRRALVAMAWDAVREQLELPPPGVHRDVVCARIKT